MAAAGAVVVVEIAAGVVAGAVPPVLTWIVAVPGVVAQVVAGIVAVAGVVAGAGVVAVAVGHKCVEMCAMHVTIWVQSPALRHQSPENCYCSYHCLH